MNAPATAIERFRSEFARVEPTLPGGEAAWLRELRHQALEDFGRSGLPSTREEQWKYTSVAAIEKRDFRTAAQPGEALERSTLEALRYQDLPCHELVFVDGRFSAALSVPGELPPGVTLSSLAEAVAAGAAGLDGLLGRCTGRETRGFLALNTAFITDGAYLRLAPDAALSLPVHLLFVSTGQAEAQAAHPRILIEAQANARAEVVETYVSLGEAGDLTNAVTEITLGEGAAVTHYKVQDQARRSFHIGNLAVQQAAHSRFVSHSVALGGALARNDIGVKLAGEGAEVTLNGLYLGRGRQHLDHHTRIDHLRPHTRSEEFYKGVLDGHARGVFNGKVVVHLDAQKIDAQQSNHNLLLSEHAEVDTKPELEIYADDVKCGHGATVGQLDPDSLFYLRARGIDEAMARSVLIYAFADDVIRRIRIEPIQRRLEQAVIGQLPGSERILEFL